MFAHHHFKNVTISLMISFALLGLLLASATSLSLAAAPFKAPTAAISLSTLHTSFGPQSLSQAITVGLSFDDLANNRWVREETIMRQILEDKGYTVITEAANGDATLQNTQINDMVAHGARVIIVVANDGTVAATAVDAAALAGVKVIAYDRLILTDKLAAYLSFNGIEVGRQQALGVLQALDIDHWNVATKGQVQLVKLGGSPTDNNAYIFRQGQDQILQPYIDRGIIHVVADQWVDNWDPANAQTIMENVLTSTLNHVDAVVASNDGTALGALQALQAHGLAGLVPISGQDATAEGCNSIVKGELTVSVLKDIRNLAPGAADLADKLLTGQYNPNLKPYTMVELTNGYYVTGTVMAYFLPAQQVNKANVYDLVVKSGFQPYDDVYLGIPPAQLPPRPVTTVTSIYPTSGLATGDTVVTIVGVGYTNSLTVTIGGASATNITVEDAGTIIATTGVHPPGLVDVAVYNPDASHATLSNAYTYLEVVTSTMVPGIDNVLTATADLTTSFEFPASAVVSPTTFLYAATITPTSPSGFAFAGHAFDLSAYQNGLLVSGFVFSQPVTVTVHYADTDLVGFNESTLTLDYWNGSTWAEAACGSYDRHLGENWLSVPICHLSQFALFGAPYHIFLPLIRR
jgi:D-xylose transport system substrate-binding protein